MSTHLRPSAVPGITLRGLHATLAGVPLPAGDLEVPITGVTLDSRSVLPGDLYAALPGARAHGASFAASAVQAGAVAVLTDERGRELADVQVPVLVVPDPRACLGELAATIYGQPGRKLRTVGITGTNGKTTTAYILDAALRAASHVTGLIGTIETRVATERVRSVRTTPESPDLHALLALMVERKVDVATMEVSSHALALHRVDGLIFDVALFTNLSQDHLDFHHTMQEYFEAKAGLFTAHRCRQGIICVDDDWGQRLAEIASVPVSTVSSDPARAADWHLLAEPGQSEFVLRAESGEALSLRSALPGDFNRMNTALAALALRVAGMSDEAIVAAIHAGVTVPGRAERVDLGPGAPQAVIDFAHTPEAVANVLAALRAQMQGPLVAVLGAGGDRDAGKREMMGARAAQVADEVVVTDDNPREEDPELIRAAVLRGALGCAEEPARCHQVAGREAAIEYALRLAGPNGLVAVLGKGHEDGQEIHGVVHPYNDRDALTQAWARCRRTPERPIS
ncbi:UDP-N-acetylmuramoyl-L-alanyl-D-glutamate--2,6-diaminopimelate ligase [Gephyromycinifex aptenodytis]|uniref:UDP-N-acetylmuramoyl-L-alanyl-D-glutamate--2, 6-diaminopimelate ligase n=1 Tax=Gephyromycinifex aptenodytis TaxID=2716227 RepID=UPI001444BAF1|nr:UDP-N-acetylmuramoyl-L-alanyl-D-glutamate--2,6-diaminopimelate ligase [Gephyromycinifex aptenodytis]